MSDSNKKQLIGQVLESSMDKTIIVLIDSRKPHPIYKKYVTQSKKCYVHDPNNQCKSGDVVSIVECSPKSKLKRWRLNKIEKKAMEN